MIHIRRPEPKRSLELSLVFVTHTNRQVKGSSDIRETSVLGPETRHNPHGSYHKLPPYFP